MDGDDWMERRAAAVVGRRERMCGSAVDLGVDRHRSVCHIGRHPNVIYLILRTPRSPSENTFIIPDLHDNLEHKLPSAPGSSTMSTYTGLSTPPLVAKGSALTAFIRPAVAELFKRNLINHQE